jgi:hypothetical protein
MGCPRKLAFAQERQLFCGINGKRALQHGSPDYSFSIILSVIFLVIE